MTKYGLLRSCRWRWLAAGLVALVMSTGAPSVRAGNEPEDAKHAAKARFMAGQKHYNLNEFPEALREFKEAYRLYSDPVFLFNLGQCERQLGHAEEAIRFYRNYLREQPKAQNRAEVQRRIDELETALKAKQAEAEKAVVPAAPAEAAAPPPSPPPIPSAPAPAEVPVGAAPLPSPEAPPANPAEAAPTVSRIDLTTAPTPPAEPVPVYKRWWVWTAAAVVLVGAGIGIYAAGANNETGAPDSGLGSKKVF